MPDETGEQTQQTNKPKGIEFIPDPENPGITIGTTVLTLYGTSDGSIFLKKEDAIQYKEALLK